MNDQAVTVPEEAPTASPGQLLTAIIQLAKDPDFDVTKLDALMKAQERMEDRQAQRLFTDALQQAQREFPQIEKSGIVNLGKEGQGKGSYKFAKWEDMDRIIRPILDRHGFSLSFNSQTREGGGAVITGTLTHAGGHREHASVPLALDTGAGRNNLQAMGSTLSYGKRYATELLLNLVRKGDDDDGKLGGTVFITAEHRADLERLIGDTKTDIARFLHVMCGEDVRDLDEIEDRDYVRLRNALETKQRQMKGE